MPACAEPRGAPRASPGDWEAVFTLLDTALELEPTAHPAWLESLGPEHAHLSPLLKELLQARAEVSTGSFMQTPPSFAVSRPVPALGPSSLVGPYRLLREIGQGGMASVWLAERADGLLERQVALKLPHVSWGIASFAERMARERNILASLTHPNIARLYDAGVAADGRPYLALEYVDGEPIDVYASAHSLSVRARVELILQVARAVAHAHARLVVHRDLKPSNILVDAAGQAHLLDFGIAKLVDPQIEDEAGAAQLTQAAGGRALTPDYASPEQIRGETIGTASDVYSLGVVAYELLAGAKPYWLQDHGAAALAQAIASVDVPHASTAAASPTARRALQGDLDAILNKALKKDVAERYASVEAFAQDIERHLANQPVQARPDSFGYRIRKFLRRNKLPVAAAAAVGVSLIAGLSVAVLQSREARAQADRAEQVKAFVLSIFADADTDSEAGAAKTAAELLKAARQRVNDETGGRPEVAVELMTAIGQSMVGQGLMADADTLLREAVDLSTRQLGPQHALTCAAQLIYGETQVELGRNQQAIAALMPCIESARRSGDLDTLNTGLRWLVTAQGNEGRVDDALESARQAVATLSARRGTGKPLGPRDRMLTYWAYADALDGVNRPGAADAARLALAAARDVYGQKTVPNVLTIRTTLALAQVNEGQIEEGVRELDILVRASADLLGPRHPRVSKVAHLAGNAKLNAGDVPGAITAFRLSMEIEDSVGGNESEFDRGMARYFLASAYAKARRPVDALRLLDESLALLKSSAGPASARTLRALSVHAWQQAEAGRLRDAEAEFQTLDAAPWTDSDRAAHQGRLAVLRALQGRQPEALALAQSANATTGGVRRRDQQARGLAVLGAIRLDVGDARKALQELQEAQSLFTQSQPGISPDHAELLVALGRAQLQLGDANAAVASLSAADTFWQAFDPDNRLAGLAKLHLAQALSAQGHKLAATQALQRADALLAHTAFPADRVLAQSARRHIAP